MGVRIFLLVCLLHLVQSDELSCEQIRDFVDGHNDLRLLLAQGEVPNQPAASNMKYMIWDNELAEKAAKWSTNDKFMPNPDRTIGSGRFTTGENIYMEMSSFRNGEFEVMNALETWADEYIDYKYGPIKTSDSTSSVEIGHYTQMAWADSIYLGCGVTSSMEDGMKKFFVVCNYGPAGNVIGQAPYETGGSTGKLTCSGDCRKKYGDKC